MTTETLAALERDGEFVPRHIGPDTTSIAAMLAELGLPSLEALATAVVPPAILDAAPPALPPPVGEREALALLRAMGERNRPFVSMQGMGYHDTELPAVIRRNVLENPAWYTAYTPYQAEISQGRLEALLAFQQVVTDMTGMDIANASLLDEATAAAEAMTLARRVSRSKSMRYFVDAACHPQTLAVVRTRARPLGIEVVTGDPHAGCALDDVFGGQLQYPDTWGRVADLRGPIGSLHAQGALAAVAADLLALALVEPPGAMGADVVLGSAQRFGVPMGYGGPHAAYFATRDVHKRQLPGRLIGVSVDARGRPALRMALQTREQHIRREKATSNICTSQVLLAVIAAFYAMYHGPAGIARIARRVHRLARLLAAGLTDLGHVIETRAYFDTLVVRVPNRARPLAARAREAGINLRVIDADRLGIACDETTGRAQVETLWRVFAGQSQRLPDLASVDATLAECLPAALRRTTPYLAHPLFNMHHSETGMLRYLRRLAGRDLALDRAMIPLGSCTMKLNATTQMLPVTWRAFGQMHPFAPLDQAQGYRQLFDELEALLCEVTGFQAFSLQPNAGSQGEYTGLLVIRKYHESRGEAGRDVCLIPASAHGTNPASAALAGLAVVVVACDDHGNVDLDDLRAKAAHHAARLAALMITYPSTHGVFEDAFPDICAVVHAHGGQVYMDGANLNALVGLARPGRIGADVAHLNLHKTFCIPHGGGGPGMGPIGVLAHLAPFLPDHPVVEGVNPAAGPTGTVGTVSAAPWGSASILPIAWAYLRLMGADGLRCASLVAILNANYVARRLAPHYPVLYTGRGGWVAHECIIDLRHFKAHGVTVEDVAKRLVDYGFHAPTMSFPVADTLMIEPTESESRMELDRFCAAMIAIRAEIEEVVQGRVPAQDSVLRHAPHTHDLLLGDWDRCYTRALAFFPLGETGPDKYWPPVARVDNVHGDRTLVCSCPPMEDWAH